jgi:molybdopterin converting factor small subunit
MLGRKYGQKWKKELYTDETEQVKPHVLILVNGQSVDRLKDNLLTVLSNNDSIIFTFPVTGG